MSGVKKNSPGLGEAELEIMQVLWERQRPMSSNRILKRLEGRRSYKLSTLMTSLSRLGAKGFVSCDRTSGSNMYSFLVSRGEYKAAAGKNFLEKLYGDSIYDMVSSLYGGKRLDRKDIEELKKFIEELEKDG